MVFQRFNLWPHMTVADNIAFGLRLRGLAPDVIAKKVADVLALVGLPDSGRKRPHQLSGGEQQRIAVGRALVLEPKILLLDEPFSNLDARLRVRMREELQTLQRQVGITTVFVTHDQEEALTLADRIAVMNKGVLEQVATPDDLYRHPQGLFVADFIGTMNFIRFRFASAQGSLVNEALRIPMPARWPDGTEVTMAIRPEDVLPVDGHAGFPVRVIRVVNLGHYRDVMVEGAGAGSLKLFTSGSLQLAESQVLRLRLRRALLYAEGAEVVEVNEPELTARTSDQLRRS
jgi:putative spermidine/putrescine transport system ATP-binding protein